MFRGKNIFRINYFGNIPGKKYYINLSNRGYFQNKLLNLASGDTMGRC